MVLALKLISKPKSTILYVAEGMSFSSTEGGVVHIKEIIRGFVKKGIPVVCVVRCQERIPPKDLAHLNIKIARLPNLTFPGSFLSYVNSIFIIWLQILVARPKLVYQRDSGINVGVMLGKLCHVPVVLEINGNPLDDDKLLNKVPKFLSERALKVGYSMASVVTTPSENLSHFLLSFGVSSKKIFVIKNGVNSEIFYPMNKFACRKKMGLNTDCFYFCFVGTLLPWQGLDVALVAFSDFMRKEGNPEVKLLIVGEGPLKDKLKRKAKALNIEKSVLFLGNVSYYDVPLYINSSDVCIAPFTSWRNTGIGLSPLKLYEYLSCGKPVIASAIPGVMELIRELDAGVIVQPDDISALCNAFREIFKNSSEYETKATFFHNKIYLNHSWDKRVEDILHIVKNKSRLSCSS